MTSSAGLRTKPDELSVAGLSVAAAATGDAGRDTLRLSEELSAAFFDVDGHS